MKKSLLGVLAAMCFFLTLTASTTLYAAYLAYRPVVGAIVELAEELPKVLHPPAEASAAPQKKAISGTPAENEAEEKDPSWVSDFESYDAYVRECLEKQMDEISIRCENGFQPPSNKEFLYLYALPYSSRTIRTIDDETTDVTQKVIYYPGARIAEAYLSGDTGGLTERERRVYDIAAEFLETRFLECENALSPEQEADIILLQEKEIHDFICETTDYYTAESEERVPDFRTALGVFLDKKANCQGYADAFEMLCRMAGLGVGKVQGETGGIGHVWNTFRYNDEWYMVDLTWNDGAFSDDAAGYLYFNIGQDLIAETHSWDEKNLRQPVAETTDSAYYYYTGAPFGESVSTYEDALALLVERCLDEEMPVYLMCEGFSPPKGFGQQVVDATAENGIPMTLHTMVQHMGENAYIYASVED